MSKLLRSIWIITHISFALLLTSCLGQMDSIVPPAKEATVSYTSTPLSTATQTLPPPTFTLTPTITITPSLTPTPEPTGCLKPPDDYTRVEVNGWTLNQRTLAMLAHAQELYGGELELTGHAITQGSYHYEEASFGTHLGGGAVDLSVLRWGTYTVLWDDVQPLLHALRAAGFAAWLREFGELSLAHSHSCHRGGRSGVISGCRGTAHRSRWLFPRL